MTITFIPLTEVHFPLLLKWLEMPHVRAWWDSNMFWTPELIRDKYETYVKGYKLEGGLQKPIQAFIINVGEVPVGYIQLYNAYDFPHSAPLTDLPESLAAVDIFIGDSHFLGKGIGSRALEAFLDKHCDDQYEAVFIDTDRENIAAINTYEKVQFKQVRVDEDTGEVWMIRKSLTKDLKI